MSVSLGQPSYKIGDTVKFSYYDSYYATAPSEKTGKIIGIRYDIDTETGKLIDSTAIKGKVSGGGTRYNRRRRRNRTRKY